MSIKRVRFLGCSDGQVSWAGHDDPKGILVIGNIYDVSKWEVHSWHTRVFLEGIDGEFNSVCFEEIEETK